MPPCVNVKYNFIFVDFYINFIYFFLINFKTKFLQEGSWFIKIIFLYVLFKVQTQIGIKHSKKRFDETRKYQKY